VRLRTPLLRRAARIIPCLLACAIATVVLPACSSDSTSVKGTVVRVTVKDFRITLSRTHVRAGYVRLVVTNKGPDTHEVLIARTSAALPLRADNITVDEDAIEPVTVDEVEAESPGAVEELGLKLRPGRYELFCNMAGHYLGGMRARLVVS
jgi:Cupredoxin-like domain